MAKLTLWARWEVDRVNLPYGSYTSLVAHTALAGVLVCLLASIPSRS